MLHFLTDGNSKSNSKVFNKTVDQQSVNCETILGPNLVSNNSDESFYLDISKLKRKFNKMYYFNFSLH